MRFGEFRPPEDSAAARWQAAKSFLQIIDGEFPAIRKRLLYKVLPIYNKLHKSVIESQLSYKIPSDGFKGIILEPGKESLHIVEKVTDVLDNWDSLQIVSKNSSTAEKRFIELG